MSGPRGREARTAMALRCALAALLCMTALPFPAKALTVEGDARMPPSVRIAPLDPIAVPGTSEPEKSEPGTNKLGTSEPTADRAPVRIVPRDAGNGAGSGDGAMSDAPSESLSNERRGAGATAPDDAPTTEPDARADDGSDDAITDDQADDALRGDGVNEAGPDLVPRTDLSALPDPVRRMHRLLVEAARAGDLAAVARLAGVGETMTELSLVPDGEDAETMLREQSGDEEGYEILAILLEILEAPYVVVDEGGEDALYLWPWFAGVSLDALTPAQQVAVYRLMTAGDFQQSLEFGTYVFFRTGIEADGRWAFFLAGD